MSDIQEIYQVHWFDGRHVDTDSQFECNVWIFLIVLSYIFSDKFDLL